MKEKTLKKIALIVTCIGLVGLFFLSDALDIEQSAIDSIDRTTDNAKVKGTVASVFSTSATTVLEIEQPSSITVILFDPNSSILEGQEVEVIGQVQEYQGKPQIIAHRIRTIQ